MGGDAAWAEATALWQQRVEQNPDFALRLMNANLEWTAAELAREGGWRASKALRAEIPGLAAALSLPPIEPPGSDSLIASVRLPAAALSALLDGRRPDGLWVRG